MRRWTFTLISSALLGCATGGGGGTRQPLGNDPTLVPGVPWQEFGRYDFTVELLRPGHIAVLRLINSSGKNSLTVVYPDSTTAAQAARRIEVELLAPASKTRRIGAAPGPQQRVVRRCIEYTPQQGADSLSRYTWGCRWTLETVESAAPFPRRGERLSEEYYLVVAFDAPQSVAALRAAASQVNAELKPAEIARQLGVALFGAEGSSRWGATLQFVP
ncbi:MAG TPA: hypothetical protein VGQ06_15620 [Gemmatimonadales bacterium]|nr:hypothetical protein [Gemmatimonadales bacterium]